VTVAVLSALRGPGEAAVVTALEGAAGRVSVTRRCADLAELLGAADAGLGQVTVLSPDLPLLDREAVVRLRAAGVRVVALVDGDARAAERMTALGVDAVADAGAPLGDLVATVLALADAAVDGPSPRSGGTPGPDPVEASLERLGAPVPPVDPGPTARGRVVAVWGPTGAPGRTTVAVNLAAELAALSSDATGGPGSAVPGERRARSAVPDEGRAGSAVPGEHRAGSDGRAAQPGVPVAVPDAPAGVAGAPATPAAAVPAGVLLVDADTYGGTVAQVVGLLDEAPGIAAAARSAGQGALDERSLARLTPVIGPGLRVLTGISRADRWPELPGSSLDLVWDTARLLAAWVVVDCGFSLEQDEVLSYDTHAPRRNAATLSALDAADVVVVVGTGDPVGVQRLVRGLAELTESGAGSGAERVVVVNRVRASVAGPQPERAVADALERYAGVTGAHLLPDDRSGVDAALLAGGTLAEAAPQSPVRTAIARLAAELAGVPAGGVRLRRRRGLRSAVRA
jgi:MinD-like ATPase involved in chromosome partitioning or flagellar assembly